MNYWLQYWRKKDVDDFFTYPNFKIDCTGSDQLRFHNKYKKGDVVWIHSIDENGNHFLLGRMVLYQKMTKENASKYVGRPMYASIKFDTYWVSEKPWLPIQKDVKINHITGNLHFEPYKPLPTKYTGRNFQSIRKLTKADQDLLQQEWDIWME